MDRQTVYPGQILPETTLLQMTKDSMVGLAKLSAAMLGTSTIASGFSTTPTSPASLQVVVAPGEIYALSAIDGTAWSSLGADTTHSILKQGISLDSVTLNCAAPATNGQSINYLVEAAYQELDATPVLLPYYNSANPSQPYSGIGNNGLTQNTVRKGAVVVQIKAGASATTGSQVTPAPDSGYVGLFVITVANAQTAITSANISQYNSAPLLGSGGVLGAVQANTANYGLDAGTANAYAVAYSPAILSLTDGMILMFKAGGANTGPCTFTVNGVGAKPLIGPSLSALQGGEIAANGDVWVQWNSSAGTGSWVMIASAGGGATASQADAIAGTSNTKWMSPLRVAQLIATLVVQAGETVFGVAKIATQALTNAGVDDTTFVTPKKLRLGVAYSFGTNGYVSLPQWMGGWTLQWGSLLVTANSANAVTFPIAFPTSCRIVMTSGSNSNNISMNGYSWTATAFSIQANVTSGGPYAGGWLALGN